MKKYFFKVLFALVVTTFLVSCNKNSNIQSISEDELFSLSYGNFEEQLSIADLNEVGPVRTGIAMRDGFFYLIDGFAKKTMEMNSYGDLLSLYYNEDSEIKTLIEKSKRTAESVHHEISYPFTYPGLITVDSNKSIYTVCTIPKSRREQGDNGILYSQAVLRFARDGSFIDYIGQQGPGGTPFPYIKNIYTTQKDELVVVCESVEGKIVYWFGSNGFLKYMIPINTKDTPVLNEADETKEIYFTIENVIPDQINYQLYVKIDYYSSFVDEDSKVQSGINYLKTYLYTLDVVSGLYVDTVSIPPYEEEIVVDYSKLTYKIPYDFLGVTSSGWKFFIVKTEDGFNIEMIQNESQKLLRRHFNVNHNNNLYYTMSLTQDGIISALYMDKDKARVVWYRTDSLIASIIKG